MPAKVMPAEAMPTKGMPTEPIKAKPAEPIESPLKSNYGHEYRVAHHVSHVFRLFRALSGWDQGSGCSSF